MTRYRTYLSAGLFLLLISSCSTTTVEEDVEEYCKCVENVEGGYEMRECLILAQDMLEKYENSPKDAKYIEDNLKKCGSNDR